MQAVQEIAAHAVYALSLQSLIEKVGAYAGFAAVVGLAVLTALYFSQARDVKRLREWAGRAPERTAEEQAGGRTPQAAAVRTGQPGSGTVGQAQPVARPAQAGGQQAAKPAAAAAGGAAVPATASGAAANSGAAAGKAAATPAGVAASSAGAAPATASAAGTAAAGGAAAGAAAAGGAAAGTAGQGAGATGAAQAGGATGTPQTPGAKAAGAQPAGTAPAGAAQAGGQQGAGSPSASAATQAKPGTTIQGAGAGAKPGASTAPVRSGAGGGGAKVLPARPAPTQRPRPIPSPATAGSQTAVIPPPGRRGRNWTAPRYLALIVAGVIVLGLGGVVGFLALTDSDGGAKKSSPSVSLPNGSGATKKKSSHKKRNFPPAIDPATVTVAVLNGTQVTGLASSTGQKVSAAGFRLGNVATASQQTPRTESVVLYQPGQSRQARAVARKLDISQIEPVDSSSAALAGAANVVVVVGADKANTQ